MLKGEVTAERTIQMINVVGPGREGHLVESWEILSTGIKWCEIQ